MHQKSVRLAALAAGCVALVFTAAGSAGAQTLDLETPSGFCSGGPHDSFCSSIGDVWYDTNLSGGRGVIFDAVDAFELVSAGIAYDLNGSTTLTFELWTVNEFNLAGTFIDDASMLFDDAGEAFYDVEFDAPIMLGMGERYLIWVSDSTTPVAAQLYSYEGRGDLGIPSEGPYEVGPVSVVDGTGPFLNRTIDGMSTSLGRFRLNALPEPDASVATVAALAALLAVRGRRRG